MYRNWRRTRTAGGCAIALAAATVISLTGCDVERPLRSPASKHSSQGKQPPSANRESSEEQQAEPSESVGPRLIPAQTATIEIHPALATSQRVYRLPPPPVAPLELPGATLLDQLTPIAEEELAGELEPGGQEAAQAPEAEGPHAEETDAEKEAPTAIAQDSVTSRAAPGRAFAVAEFDDDAQLAVETSIDDVLAYFPAENELSRQFQPRVREAFTLARHGALHAAKRQFEDLLGELAQAKDASQMTDRHSRALAAGLRALREADDFAGASNNQPAPQAIAAGHQTPMLHEGSHEWTLPHEAIAMYHLYAQQKLAAAVTGEQAGSMMLFGLGKIHTQLAERDHLPQAIRKSLTMYRSALGAHQKNYLAANEAGVLLARAGRYAQALPLLDVAAQIGGSSATHRNLAHVHTKLGDAQLASQHRNIAMQVARREMARGQLSTERGIAWVSPQEFNRRSHSTGGASLAQRSRPTTAPAPQQGVAPAHTQVNQQTGPQRVATPGPTRTPMPQAWW